MTESLSWADLVKDAGDVAAFEPLPDGDYDCTVHDAVYKPTKTGKKMYSVTYTVDSGPYAKRRVWDNLVVTPESPGALNYFFRKMGVLGLDIAYFQSNPGDTAIANALKGRRARLTLGKRTYNGNVSNEVKTYNKVADAGTAPQAAPGSPLPPSVAAAPAPAPAPAPVAAPPAPPAVPGTEAAAPAVAPAGPPAAPTPPPF